MTVIWHNHAVLCIRESRLTKNQRSILRRFGFSFDKSKGYWTGCSFRQEEMMIRKVIAWGGIFLYNMNADDPKTVLDYYAPEYASSRNIHRMMIKQGETFFEVSV